MTEADLASEEPLQGAPRSGRIFGRRPFMGQGGSKIFGAKRRPGTGAREAAVKLDEIDEEDLASLSDEDLDLLLAAEADLAVEGQDDRATGSDASSTADFDARGAERSSATSADSSGEGRGDGGNTEGALGGQGSGPVEASPAPPRSLDPRVSSLGPDASRSKRNAATAALAAASLEASSALLKQSLAAAAAASAGALRRACAHPARAARVVAGGLCGGVAKAVAHALLVASAECFAPTRIALTGVRAGSALVACGATLRAASSVATRGTGAEKRAAQLLGAAFLRRPDVVFPVPASVSRDARARALAVVARRTTIVCTAYLRNALRLRAASRAGAAIAPIKTRQISYAIRVAPLVGAYAARREWIRARTEPGTRERDAAWRATHAWGAERVKAIVLEYGGFFTKIGQLMGTAQQMMPEAYVEAFSQTMDANPPAPFAAVRAKTKRVLEEARSRDVRPSSGGVDAEKTTSGSEDARNAGFRDVFDATFSEFDEAPAATASIAQVHFARLRGDGARVAVKVVVADKKTMLSDLACASRTAEALRRLGLDTGADLCTVFAAYSDVVDEEFDLLLEAEKMREFRTVFEEHGLGEAIAVPETRDDLSGAGALVSTRVRGVKLLNILNRARESGRRPRCPSAATTKHAFSKSDPRYGGWDGVFHTMHRAWGVMLLRHGHFHCDPHPGNFILQKDGKLAILDWGQTHSFAPPFQRHLCRLVVHMAGEHHEAIAAEVREHSQVRLEHPTTEALSALCFAYFDTRATPLAEVNLLDLQNSPFLRNKITRNTREGFNVIRCVFLFRGMMAACGVDASMIEVWEQDARKVLAEANEPVPSLLVSRSRRAATRAWLAAQRTLNVGAGARLNTLEAFARSGNAPPRTRAADDTQRSGLLGSGTRGTGPGTPRRMRSALW